MIIKIIPETADEKKELTEKEYRGVRDYFIFGKNINEKHKIDDFHDWRTSSYRYLFSSLKYFAEIVNDERKDHESRRSMNSIVQPQLKMVDSEIAKPEVVEAEVVEEVKE